MDTHAVFFSDGAKLLELLGLVAGSQLCRLRQGKNPGSGIMDILSFCDKCLHRRRGKLSSSTRSEKEFRPVAKEFWRPAFIRLNMGGVVGNDAVVRLTERSQRK